MAKFLLAPNAFKGTLSPLEAGCAIKEGIISTKPDASVVLHPITDGGDGFISCIKFFKGGDLYNVTVSSPLGNEIEIPILISGSTAYIESAKCVGHDTVKIPEGLHGTSKGVGQAVKHAISYGAKKVFVGLGGSLTVDMGLGLAAELGVKFFNSSQESVTPFGGKNLAEISSCSINSNIPHDVKLFGICDVQVPLSGKSGGIRMFSPQKGASPEDVDYLDTQAIRLGEIFNKCSGRNTSSFPGAGAAGGIGAAMSWFFNAELLDGFDWFFRRTSLKMKLEAADFVITGEGSFDATSFSGKATCELLKRILVKNSPLWRVFLPVTFKLRCSFHTVKTCISYCYTDLNYY